MNVVEAMRAAMAAATDAMGVSSPNPPVGAAIIAADGTLAGLGATQPAGGPHAEVMALAAAGEAARGGTAVVTLEPCAHTGRTGPCTEALIAAGVAEVYFGVSDPNPIAAGGADRLRAAGVRVHEGFATPVVAAGALAPWLVRQRLGRPMVTAKLAAGLDGRVAAPDGTSQWITGDAARRHAHEVRARVDAIVVGTGTALADDPSLTARLDDGSLADHQPTRVVVGHRELPPQARLRDGVSPLRQVATHDPAQVLAALPDALWVLVEGGPQVLGAFFDAGLVDEVDAYLAPMILGAGRAAIEQPGVTTLTDATRFDTREVTPLDDGDVLIRLTRPLS